MIAVNNLGKSGLIDSNLNNAYKVVKFLADNLVTIQNLTSTVEAIKAMQDVAYIANHIENNDIHLTESQVTQIKSITDIQAQIQAILQALEDTCNCNNSTSEVSNAHIANQSIHTTQAEKDKLASLHNFDPSTLNLSPVATSGSYNDLTDKPTNNFQEQIDSKAPLSLISKVGKTNNYDDLDNKPIIDQDVSSGSANAVSSKAVFEAIQTITGGYVDVVGNVYTKQEIDTKFNELPISITSEEVNTLISNSLVNHYTKEEVDTKLDNLPIPDLPDIDLSDYYTKEEVDTKLDNLPTSDLTNYYNKEEVNELIDNISIEGVSVKAIPLSTIEEICV